MQRSRFLFFIVFASGLLAAPAFADGLTPHAKEFDLEFANMSAFTGANSFVQVRENSLEGTRLGFSDLGIKSAQIPNFNATYWVSDRNSLNFQFRYFIVRASQLLKEPALFNGATLAAGQTLRVDPVWYSVEVSYGHRWSKQASSRCDLRTRIGLEYTFIDFRINKGHAAVTPSSIGTETKEDFYLQELPIPTLALEVRRRMTESMATEASVEGNWINRWNSQRSEGGSVYLSQRKLEAHLRLRWANERRLKSLHPMIGLFYFNFRQLEESGEDTNLIRWVAFGPEVGAEFQF